jgi:hypothetical protein
MIGIDGISDTDLGWHGAGMISVGSLALRRTID